MPGYWDPTDGRSVVLAVARNVAGQQVATNVIMYGKVFQAPSASVRYVYERRGLHQDVILHEAPPPPSALGLSDSAWLEVTTEWRGDTAEPLGAGPFQPPLTNQAAQVAAPKPELVDHKLAFGGEMRMGVGRAFQGAGGNGEALAAPSLPVLKEFRRIDGRPVMIERIEYRAAKTWFDQLSSKQAGARGNGDVDRSSRQHAVVSERTLPERGSQAPRYARAEAVQPAAEVALTQGVVLDYVFELNGSKNSWLFANDTNYWVTGPTTLNGVTFEGGVCIKFKKGASASLNLYRPVVCKTTQYFPAVLTADEDDSIGDFIYPWNPLVAPSGSYASIALNVCDYGITLQNLRISYAQEAIRYNDTGTYNQAGQTLRNVQIVNCNSGVKTLGNHDWNQYVTLGNVLVVGAVYPFRGTYSYLTGSHITVDGGAQLGLGEGYPVTLSFNNSIFANIPSLALGWCSVGGTYDGFYNCGFSFGGTTSTITPTNPFRSFGNGNHYLASDSALRQKGTTGLDATTLADLKTRTTQGPIVLTWPLVISEDTLWTPQAPRYASGSPDLGYHYDPLDYLVACVWVQNARLRVCSGTVIGGWMKWFDVAGTPLYGYGIDIGDGGDLLSQGNPTNLNRFIGSDLVHEAYNHDAARASRGLLLYDPRDNRWYTFAGFASVLLENLAGPAPSLTCRFTDFALLSDNVRHHVLLGCDENGFEWSDGGYAGLRLQDCQFRGAAFWVSYYGSPPVGPITLVNNLYERVATLLSPGADIAVEARNNLFRGGSLDVESANAASWTLTDNLFDGTLVGGGDVTGNFNAYWQTTGRLTPYGAQDVLLGSAPAFMAGALGPYYQATGSPLDSAGSRSPGEAGLYHYTTRTDQVKDADQARVNLGLHYVALATGETLIDHSTMTASASSVYWAWPEANAIDGYTTDPGWHNATYTGTSEFLRLDLGTSKPVCHLRYMPRQMNPLPGGLYDGTRNGVYRDYQIYVTDSPSSNPTDWGSPVASGQWQFPGTQEQRDVTFPAQTGRYVYLRRVTAWGWYGPEDPYWAGYGYPPGYASANEVWVYQSPSGPLDSDSDGLPDFYEDENGDGSANDRTSWQSSDSDSNGVRDGDEDADGDGVPDKTEYALGTDPLNGSEDYDHDGLDNYVEQYLGTNPLVPDSPIQIVGLNPSSPLSGTVTVQVQVPSGFACGYLYLVANGGEIPGTGGQAIEPPSAPTTAWFTVDTKRLPNGLVTLVPVGRLRKANAPGGLWQEEIPGQPVQVTVANEISFVPVYSASGLLIQEGWDGFFEEDAIEFRAASAHPSATFEMRIYTGGGQPVKTVAATDTANGAISFPWDLLDDAGNARPENVFYAVVTTYYPSKADYQAGTPGSGTASATSPSVHRLTWAPGDGWWVLGVQDLLVNYTNPNDLGKQEFYQVYDSFAEGMYNASGGTQPIPAGASYNRAFSLKYDAPWYQQARNASWATLKAAVADSRAANLLLASHGNPTWVGGDVDADQEPFGTISLDPAATMTRDDVANLLQHNSATAAAQGYRFVFLDGCQTQRGWLLQGPVWPSAFGIENTSRSFDWYQNNKHRPAAFCGWKNDIPLGQRIFNKDMNHWGYGYVYRGLGHYRSVFMQNWQSGIELQEAFKRARDACAVFPYNDATLSPDKKPIPWGKGLVITGYKLLHFSGTE